MANANKMQSHKLSLLHVYCDEEESVGETIINDSIERLLFDCGITHL